jgi:hypothetical protein
MYDEEFRIKEMDIWVLRGPFVQAQKLSDEEKDE